MIYLTCRCRLTGYLYSSCYNTVSNGQTHNPVPHFHMQGSLSTNKINLKHICYNSPTSGIEKCLVITRCKQEDCI